MNIRTILVDDEKLATQGLEMRLAPFPDVEIVAHLPERARGDPQDQDVESPIWFFSTSRCPVLTAFRWCKG
jgi:hypothetical protein